MKKNIEELEKIYDLELEKIAEKIIKEKAKKILLQFPDFFKLYSTSIVDKLKEIIKKKNSKLNPIFFIWIGSCFGSCDVPNVKDFDIVVQFGHSSLKSFI